MQGVMAEAAPPHGPGPGVGCPQQCLPFITQSILSRHTGNAAGSGRDVHLGWAVLGAFPVTFNMSSDAEVGFGIFSRVDPGGGSAITRGKIDNIALSTDGSNYTSYDNFDNLGGDYSGGSK